MNAVLADFGKMLPRLLSEDIALETSYANKLPAIEADAGMIEQIIMNLAVNARDAMPRAAFDDHHERDGDRRTLRAAGPKRVASLFPSASRTPVAAWRPRRWLAFLNRFFHQGGGRGTGLGLATVYGIVKQHHGWVEVTSAVGVRDHVPGLVPGFAKVVAETDDQTIPS